jgi:predicted amidohydrolase YtcJ
MRGLMWAVALGLALGCVKRVIPARERTIVFIASRIHTLDAQRPEAQALAFRRGSLVAVGTEAEVLAAAGPQAIVERFDGAVIVPGLVDAHGHLASLGRSLGMVDLGSATTSTQVLERLTAAPKSAFQGDWLLGRGWNERPWDEGAAVLEARFSNRPVCLWRADGNAVWLNSEARRRAGVTAKASVLQGEAMVRVTSSLPAPTPEQLQWRLKVALEHAARVGWTQVHDVGMDLPTFRQLQSWDLLGVLPIRVYALADAQAQSEAQLWLDHGTFKGQHLELKGVSLRLDGRLENHGAALTFPYADAPERSGALLLDPPTFQGRAQAFAQRGFQLAVDATGDRAIHLALEVLGSLGPSLRHRVEGPMVLDPGDLDQFARLGVVAVAQPLLAERELTSAVARLGAQRTASSAGAIVESGARVALGTQGAEQDLGPLASLAALRSEPSVPPVPGQKALEGLTSGGAFAGLAEAHRGRLRAGDDADFVVLSVDPVRDSPAALLQGRVLVTVVDGVDVFRLRDTGGFP